MGKREEQMEEILVKCPNCGTESLSGQRFCSSCGVEQKLPVKTPEQIQQMRASIKDLCKPTKDGEMSMPVMMFGFATYIEADTALKWAMGYVTDEELCKAVKPIEGEKG